MSSDVVEMWKERREALQRRKAERRKKFDVSEIETIPNVVRVVRNSDAHYSVFTENRRIEYWPGTTRWHLQGEKKSQKGSKDEFFDFIRNL